MFCPKCGKINPDDAIKCSGCDALLKEETAVAVPSKKSGALKWIITIAVILVIIAVIVFFMSGCSGAGELPKEKLTF